MTSQILSSVFITGCNRGLGLGLVKQLLSVSTKHIFATYRCSEEAKQLQDLATKHANLHLIKYDVTDFSGQRPNEIADIVTEISADSGLSLLVNNAGVTVHESFYNVTGESLRMCYDVNTIGPLMITKALFPLLKHTAAEASLPSPVVVNISSKMGSIEQASGPQFVLPYRLSKASLNMLTKSLSIALGKYGITTLAVCPGWVQTGLGGKYAPLSVEQSVSSLLELFSTIDHSKNGSFLNHDGTTIPW